MNRQESLRASLCEYGASGDETAALARMLELLEGHEDPFARSSFHPGHFTASGFVLSPSLRHLLLICHSKLGRWLQPGGHVEGSDTRIIDAARREVEEETGQSGMECLVDRIFDIEIHTIPERGLEPKHEHFDVRYLFRGRNDELSPSHGARWVLLEEVPRQGADASVLRALCKLSAATAGAMRRGGEPRSRSGLLR